MIVHVVLFTWNDGVSQSQIQDLDRAFSQLPAKIPELKKLTFGSDVKFRGGNADYGLIAVFADEAGWRAYQNSASHKSLVANFIAPMTATRVAIQMSAFDS